MRFFKEYLKLLKFLKGKISQLVLAFILMGFTAIFDGVSIGMIVPLADNVLTGRKIIVPRKLPDFLENIIQKFNSLEPLVLLKMLSIGVIILLFLKSLFMFLRSYIMNDLGLKVLRDVRAELFEKLQKVSLDFFEEKSSGEIVSRLTNDVGLIQNAVTYALTDLIQCSFQIIVFSFIAFYINWKLALISFVLFPSIIFPIIKIGKRIKKLATKSQEKIADINSLIVENAVGQRVIKAFNIQKLEIENFNKKNFLYYKFQRKLVKRNLTLSPMTEFIGALGAVFLFFVGGKQVIRGEMSFGIFGLFIGSLLSMIRPFKKLSNVHSINQSALSGTKRIYEILEEPIKVKNKRNCLRIKEFKKEILFEEVWFRYKDTDWILKGINLRVKKGEKIAIIGKTGVGKSTLLDLIPRFYDSQKGRILIDGTDLRDICLENLRDLIGIVTQDPILFNLTIEENVALGKRGASFKEIKRACELAFADEFVEKLPRKYKTMVGERGVRLSGGEKQRLAIARAILKDPQILILDEATSQLDSESERIVQLALERLMENRTVFIIAHRLSTVRNCSKIVVLEKGKIAEIGTHTELLKEGKIYPYFYNLQFRES